MSSTEPTRTPRLRGVIAAMLTPMRDRGTHVDLDATNALGGLAGGAGRAWVVHRGDHGRGALPEPGGASELVRAVVNAAKGIPVVAHVGALTTAQAVGLARQAVQAGATAVAAIPPPYYSLNREELLTYFTAIAQAAAPLSLYLYNIPSHARNEVPPPFAADLGRAIPTLRGIKDSSGAPGRISVLVKTLGPDYDVVCGNDDKILQAFQVGAAGIVASGASVFPELYLGLHAAWKAGRVAEAEEAQRQIVAMQQALGNGARLGWYKYVLAQRGVPVGGVRGPLADVTLAEQEAIQKRLKDLRLL